MHSIKYWILMLPTFVLSACAAPGPFPQSQNQPLVPMKAGSEHISPSLQKPANHPVKPEALPDTTTAGDAQLWGPTPEQQAILDGLRDWGQAPELTNEIWLNSVPLTLAKLQGQVVLVEFWTFGCINCRNVLPAMRDWYAKYKDLGLEIVAVHTPEFSYERDLANVEDALVRLDVPWPVAIDNDWNTWRTYNNHYWPAMYFVDKTGNVRHLKIGEGQYEHTESIIQALLAEQP